MALSSFFLSFLSDLPLGLLCFVARRPSLQLVALEDRQTRDNLETGGTLVQWFVLLIACVFHASVSVFLKEN